MPNYNYSGKGGMLSGGNTSFMPSLSKATNAGLSAATGGGSDIAAGVLSLIPTIFQSIVGISQMNKASKIEAGNKRPDAEIAPSVDKLVNYNYGQTLNQDIPGGGIARDEIKGATAAGIRAASELGSGSEAYGALGELVGREQNAFSDLARLTAQDVAGKKDAYANSLLAKGQEENRVWDWNKAQPYLNAANIAAQLRDSGMKNVYSGVANASGSLAESVSPDLNSSLLNGGVGKNGGGSISMDELMQIIKQIRG